MKSDNTEPITYKQTDQPTVDDLTRTVKEKALSLGAHLVGIAPISHMDSAPPDLHPRRYLIYHLLHCASITAKRQQAIAGKVQLLWLARSGCQKPSLIRLFESVLVANLRYCR